jgi:hypothetical protein
MGATSCERLSSIEMTEFVSGVHSTPIPHSTEICKMSGPSISLKGKCMDSFV